MHVAVRVKSRQGSRKAYTRKFLVDTGATDSIAPASALRKAGIRPVGLRRYELADGSYVEYPFGLAQIEFLGEITAGRIIFGSERIEPVLGVTQLESAGIARRPGESTPRAVARDFPEIEVCDYGRL